MIGVIANTILVITGTLIGLLLKKGIPEKIKKSIMTGLGLFTCILGIKFGLEMNNGLVVVLSIVAGGALGQLIGIEEAIERLGLKLNNLIKTKDKGFFAQGFVFASLLFCIGPMTVLGCVHAGLENNPELLFIKSLMDGVSAIILASSFGVGVLFSALTVFFYQGGLVLLAGQMGFLTTSQYLNDFTSVGGIIIFSIGIKLLGLKPIKSGNFLPALVLVILITFLASVF
jgi:uncharacterized membrane protein YqgA involved in biofilm formation